MAKSKSKYQIFAEYAAVRAFFSIMSTLPLAVSAWAARCLCSVWRLVDKRHRDRVKTQVMERAGLPETEAARFVRKNYQHYGNVIAEFCFLGKCSLEEVRKRINMDGFDHFVKELLEEHKGVVVITGHLGNWEWANCVLTAMDEHGCAIARPLDNPRLNEFIRTIRERIGCKILDKQGAIRGALKCLRGNGGLAVLIDQDAGYLGMMSPFLGLEAATISIPIELAIKAGCPVIVAAMVRDGKPGWFRMHYSREVLRARDGLDTQSETKRLVDAANAALGELIIKTPDQWFWVHRRWKTRNGRVL